MKIAVGSENPVKINAVKHAFSLVWPKKKFNVMGIAVKSGVSEQPMSDAECVKGATQRAKKSMKELGTDYGVGLEGGLNKIGSRWFDCGWCVVIDRKGITGLGTSARMHTPRKIMDFVWQGKEIGDADDFLFNTKFSKKKGGHFGLMTNGLITRTDAYKDCIVFALSRFLHPELF